MSKITVTREFAESRIVERMLSFEKEESVLNISRVLEAYNVPMPVYAATKAVVHNLCEKNSNEEISLYLLDEEGIETTTRAICAWRSASGHDLWKAIKGSLRIDVAEIEEYLEDIRDGNSVSDLAKLKL